MVRDRQGAIVRLSAERALEPDAFGPHRREPTERYETLFGERCRIWVWSARFLNQESCETADGIQLWSRRLTSAPGKYLSSERAVSFERRPVRPVEVRPPPDFFQLAPWPKLTAGAGPGFEVRLDSTTRGEQVRRRQGSLTSRRHDPGDGTHNFWGSNELGQYFYQADDVGRPVRLQVVLWSTPPLRLPRPGDRWEAVAGRDARTVLGENCTWQEETSTRSTDAHYECRTADGIPLMLEDDWHWHDTTDVYTAHSLARRPLTEADVAPPAESIDWLAWGVVPAP